MANYKTPTKAYPIIETPEYTAWKSLDSAEVWIVMEDRKALIPHAAITAAIQTVWNENGTVEKVYLSGDMEPFKPHEPAISAEGIYVSDFGIVEIFSLNPAVAA